MKSLLLILTHLTANASGLKLTKVVFKEIHSDGTFQILCCTYFSSIFSKYPLCQDALERKQVYVATTKHSENSILNEDLGEGLFLKKEVLQKGMLLAFFNGVRKKKTFSSFQGMSKFYYY